MPSTKSETKHVFSWQFDALGTAWEITSSRSIAHELRDEIREECEAFEQTYSRFREGSLITKASNIAASYIFPANSEILFSFYDELFALTYGKVTPMVGTVLASAGYDASYSLTPRDTIDATPSYYDTVHRKGRIITMTKPALIDVGAAGKGYLVDIITDMLQRHHYDTFTVDASGDMRVVGSETVGLEDPRDPTKAIGTVDITDKALCASASNRRRWGDWHHIIDPETNKPTNDIVATWVIADTAMIADGLATALFFVNPQILAKRYTYEYVRMHADGGIEYSDYFAKGVFS